MKSSMFLFVLFFAFSYLSTLFILKNSNKNYNDINSNYIIVAATTLPTAKPRKASPTSEPTLRPTLIPRPKDDQPLAETPTPNPTPTPVPTPTPDVWSPPDIEPIMARFAGQYGVDKNLLERLANCESHFNSDAQNGDYLGLFQFSTRSWQDYRNKMGEDTNPELRRNIEASIKTAAYVVSRVGTKPWPRCLN